MTADGTTPGPVNQLEAGKTFFSGMGLDVSHFGALWHLFKVGQLMATDLNHVSGQHGLSIADFHLLGALMMADPEPMRATDLARALNVSNAALSMRVTKLGAQGLLTGSVPEADRRTRMLRVTEAGALKVRLVGEDLENAGRFVRHYRRLPAEDRAALDRIMATLHTQMNRDFVAAPRG